MTGYWGYLSIIFSNGQKILILLAENKEQLKDNETARKNFDSIYAPALEDFFVDEDLLFL